eukprot:scaffold825_cov249-Pinguiococcus_pyrenoidosus.AAC.47
MVPSAWGVESDGEDVSAHLTGIAISLLSSLLPSFPPKHEEPVVQLSISQRQSLVHAIFGVLRVWGRKFDSALASLQSKVERHQGLLHSGSVLLSSEAGAAQVGVVGGAPLPRGQHQLTRAASLT